MDADCWCFCGHCDCKTAVRRPRQKLP
jgi:hypothetical protein